MKINKSNTTSNTTDFQESHQVQIPILIISIILLIYTLGGLLGWLEGITVFQIRLVLLANFITFWGSYKYLKGFSTWFSEQTTENIILLHVIRAPIGVTFLLWAEKGILSEKFANIAGWGDIITGTWAFIAVILCYIVKNRQFRFWNLSLWCFVGIIDLISAISTGINLYSEQAAKMSIMTELPFLLVPGFLVPWMISCHLVIFRKLWLEKKG